PVGYITSSAYPAIIANQKSHGGIELDNLKINSVGSSVLLDETLGPGGIVGMVFKNVSFISQDIPALTIKGGFHFWLDKPTCSVLGMTSGTYRQPPCISMTTGSAYLTAQSQAAGDIIIEKGNFSGAVAVQLDNIPMNSQPNFNTIGPPGNCTFRNNL